LDKIFTDHTPNAEEKRRFRGATKKAASTTGRLVDRGIEGPLGDVHKERHKHDSAQGAKKAMLFRLTSPPRKIRRAFFCWKGKDRDASATKIILGKKRTWPEAGSYGWPSAGEHKNVDGRR